ncbi:MAG: YceI family protein [Bacteroidota bacterium]
MKTSKHITLLIVALMLTLSAWSQDSFKPQATVMTVTGSSTLHEWTSEVDQVAWTGTVTLNGDRQLETKNLVITIPVKSIRSSHGKMMDNKTYEAFKHDKNPNIIYKVNDQHTKAIANDTQVEITGTLTMAGVSKVMPLLVKIKTLPNGNVVITGSRKLNMVEFKMDPPTAMMGTINVGEEVTVNFESTLTPNKI